MGLQRVECDRATELNLLYWSIFTERFKKFWPDCITLVPFMALKRKLSHLCSALGPPEPHPMLLGNAGPLLKLGSLDTCFLCCKGYHSASHPRVFAWTAPTIFLSLSQTGFPPSREPESGHEGPGTVSPRWPDQGLGGREKALKLVQVLMTRAERQAVVLGWEGGTDMGGILEINPLQLVHWIQAEMGDRKGTSRVPWGHLLCDLMMPRAEMGISQRGASLREKGMNSVRTVIQWSWMVWLRCAGRCTRLSVFSVWCDPRTQSCGPAGLEGPGGHPRGGERRVPGSVGLELREGQDWGLVCGGLGWGLRPLSAVQGLASSSVMGIYPGEGAGFAEQGSVF